MTNQERMEQIVLPKELDQVILEAVNLGRSRKSKMTWKRVGLSCMGAAAAFVLLVVSGFASPVAAQAFEGIPAVGKVFTYLYDLAGYEGRYAQIAEDARPAVPVGQAETDRKESGQNESVGSLQTAVDQQENTGRQDAVTTSDAGITITVNEYFCDKQSLYLSMTIESETPFLEGEMEENMEGYIQLFTKDETLAYEGAEPILVGNSSLIVDGVYLDDHTFVGIARSEWRTIREEKADIPDELIYAASIGFVRIYTELGSPEVSGQWEFSMDVLCEKDAITVLPVEVNGEDGSSICEIRLHPYEVMVVTKSETAGKMLVAFDEQGNLLDFAGSTLSYQEDDKEIYEYARPENLDGLELFILDENSWMNQWKGMLYDGTITGSEMVEFLKDHCVAHVFVDDLS
ncbi:MAG: DUF4179 domain-containing protein [Candidatus Gastranaerophilales bacterium]|nr:DUF4179 domain-containing protein [Candidatus Gastranaerophilales bacterium]